MKTRIILISIFLSMFIFASCQETATIKGIVSDNTTAKAIGAVNVKLIKDGKIIHSTKSNSKGEFEFAQLNAATYSLSFSKSTFQVKTLKSIQLNKSEFRRVTVFMNAIAIKNDSIRIIKKENLELVEKITTVDVCCDQVAITNNNKLKTAKANYCVSSFSQGNTGGSYQWSAGDARIPHNTESYDYINENSFKNSLNDPLSTFSIDVDRASYANVRRFINNSQMPYKDAVRIEELINYFDYSYENPSGEHPFASHLEIGKCPWNNQHQLMMIGIQGKEMSSTEIPASNLIFLIDVSGSMSSSNKLGLLKKSFKILVEKLRPQDKVSIVVYAGAAGCVLPATSGSNKKKILASLNQLKAGGSTAGGDGIKLAYKIAKDNFIEGGNNRVILATDGDFNVGASSNAEMERLIEEKREDGVFLTILGFGMGNYKDSRMELLSNKGNGNYAYIDNIMEANKIFGKELWGTLFTIAKDVKIQIEFNPAKVKEYRLIGYENRMLNKEDFNDDKKDAGEIGSGHTVTAIYELVMNDDENLSGSTDPLNYQKNNLVKSNDIMTLKIRYKKPDQDVSRLITKKVMTKDMKKKTMSPNFMLATSIAEFGMLLRDSKFKGESSYEHAIAHAEKAKSLDEDGYVSEYISLIKKVKLIKN